MTWMSIGRICSSHSGHKQRERKKWQNPNFPMNLYSSMYVMGSLAGVSSCVCWISLGKVLSHNNKRVTILRNTTEKQWFQSGYNGKVWPTAPVTGWDSKLWQVILQSICLFQSEPWGAKQESACYLWYGWVYLWAPDLQAEGFRVLWVEILRKQGPVMAWQYVALWKVLM